MKIDTDVINVLANSRVGGHKLFLPDGQLDRKLYVSVDKVLKALNGKWNRKEKAHIFIKPVEDIIEEVLLTGEYVDQKKEYNFFETPPELARTLVRIAGIHSNDKVLEPSAGRGAIASLIRNCYCAELNDENRTHLIRKGLNVVGVDFFALSSKYDVIIANPPFSKQQDIDHINHMLDLATRRVVSVASAGVVFRDNKKTITFRKRIESLGGSITKLPEKSFSVSGTAVNTCIVDVWMGSCEHQGEHKNGICLDCGEET